MAAKKIVIISVSAVFALILTACFIAGNYLVNFALADESKMMQYESTWQRFEKMNPGITQWYQDLEKSGAIKDTVIVNKKGYRQFGVYASAINPEEAKGTAVLVHGWTANMVTVMPIARMYRDSLNFNILLFDQESHGKSEGNAIQMGWFDRYNAAMWSSVANNLWHNDFMIVHGVSMGAATVMMLSGDPDPEWVSAYVEDCGYTSVWDEFKMELKENFHLPAFPVLNIASMVCKLRFGWDFKEASSVAQLAKSTKPMLFIHGDSDDFVPTSDVYKNYDAKTTGYKEMWIAPDTPHSRSYAFHPHEYKEAVEHFISSIRGN